MFAPRYFAQRYFPARYFPPSITIVIVERQPSGVRSRRRYIRLERLPEPAYIDRYIDEKIQEALEEEPEIIQEIVKEAIYQYEQTGEEEDIILAMFMLDWI